MDSLHWINSLVSILLIASGIFGVGVNRHKNQWLVRLISPLGYRVLLFLLGVLFLYVTWFTNYFGV